MAQGDDSDRTMIGGPLPQAPRPDPGAAAAGNAFGWPPPLPAGGEGDRTVVGGALPPAGSPPGYPPQGHGGYPPLQPPLPGAPVLPENPWSEALPPQQPGMGAGGWPGGGWAGGPQPGYYGAPPGQPAPGFGIGLGAGLDPMGGQGPVPGGGFFPRLQPHYQPGPAPAPQPRIPLQQALRATGIGEGGPSNPLLAGATNLLILFGRLRTGIVEMDPLPLMEHVTREIDSFERRAIAAGAPPQEALVAKYLLCGTADDIVQNLPGADRGLWIQYSMAARFFNTRDTGVGFFREAEKAIQSPAQYANLLELMQVCLSLGFEGQYRTMQGGPTQLARIRAAIYETVRRVRPRPDEDLSQSWQPVLIGGRRRFGAIPVWAIGGIAAAVLVAFFATLSTLITREGAAAAQALYTLHPTGQKIALNGQLPAQPFVAQTASAQLDRIRAALKPEIDQDLVSVGEIGDFIYMRVGNLLLFNSGQAAVRPEFAPLASRIAQVVNAETGPVLIEGHTDAQPLSGRGRYKTNLELSLARAAAVGEVLAPLLADPARLRVEGRGEAQPIADNATAEGRARNRRVEVMIAKEGTFAAP